MNEQGSTLVKYEAARQALAEAHRVDEVKDIRDKAVAMQVYARQAKDHELIEHATEIRMRAERRLGEMLEAGRADRAQEGRPEKRVSQKPVSAPTLQEILGSDHKNLANRARKAAALTDEQFEAKVEQAKKVAVTAIERAMTTEEKQQNRANREAELAAKQMALPEKQYGVVYADPPWRFEPYSRNTGMDRAADNHYPTMTLDGIKALAVPAADDAVLFLWATAPMLMEALDVMAAWRFWYRSHFVWAKDRIGTGYWARSQHELLLIGVKGSIPAPAPGKQYASVIPAPVGEHSAKPFCFREMIEDMFPNLPRVELFAREKFDGWDCWGKEAPE